MPGPPPPPPPPGPPPPPAGPSFSIGKAPGKSGAGGANNRDQLLNSIRGGATLRKTVTNDRSAPIIEGKPGGAAGAKAAPLSQQVNGPPSSSSNGVSAAPQLAGLFAGGMPTLKATGRGRMGPVAPAAPPASKPAPLPSQAAVPAWKKTGAANGSINRGPPPQPPPANRKPSLVSNDVADSNTGDHRRACTAKPSVANYGKPNLAPKPPVPENKPPSPSFGVASAPPAPPPPPQQASSTTTTTAPPPPPISRTTSAARLATTTSTKPLPPPKSPSVTGDNFSLVVASVPPPPPPPNCKPNIQRAHSLRSEKSPARTDDCDQLPAGVAYQDAPPPPSSSPTSRFATLPRHRHIAPVASPVVAAPRGPMPLPQRSALFPAPAAFAPSPMKSGPLRPPSVRPPPPPPQRINPPASLPPPPPSNAPPPPPPHRMNPAPPPPPPITSLPTNNNNRIQSPCAPPPPERVSSKRTTNGSVTSLHSAVSSASLASSSATLAAGDDFEARFAHRFHPLQQLPPPERFTAVPKIYPTRQLANQSMKRQQAPQPPSSSSSARIWSHPAPC